MIQGMMKTESIECSGCGEIRRRYQMRVGRKCKWEDIKVGEVYALERNDNIFEIEARHSNLDYSCSIILEGETWGYTDDIITSRPLDSEMIYKLPLSVQRLWKEE